jgi:LacI family transcriptional regulator, galactose operon repressor
VQTFADSGVERNYEIFLSSMAQEPLRLEVAALVEIFRRRNVPTVVVDGESPGPLLKSIRIGYQHGIRQALQHLAAMGHVRIAFISGPAHLRTATARRVAFQECMKEIGLQISPTLLVDGDHTMEAGMRRYDCNRGNAKSV